MFLLLFPQVAPLPNPADELSGRPSSKVFCPICIANGYSAGTQSRDKTWFIAGNSAGGALWNSAIPRLQLGLGFHGSSRAVRGLVSYRAITENSDKLALNIGYGFQSQETNSTGFSSTVEWNPILPQGEFNGFVGASLQTKDSKVRPVFGLEYSPDRRWFIGNQFDGRDHNPFIQRSFRDYSVGLLYIGARRLTLTAGYSF